MKLDEINDIEILRTELKKCMVKCTKTFNKKGYIFNSGEYYHIEQDAHDVYIFADTDEMVIISYDEAKKYLN